MSFEYNYDNDAQFFPFFVLTITSLITVPLSYSLLRKPSDISASRETRQISSSYKPKNADIIEAQRAKQKRKELRLKRMLTAAGGWLVMAYMVYLMSVTSRSTPKLWNPYEILELSMDVSEKDIHRRYRQLSVKMHPDKREPDLSKNETMDTVNNEYIEIVKAYKALTDEEIRNNFIQYGNPDGKQSTSFGIALPQFLVAEGSGKYVLIFYGALLGIGLPWLVGHWWYGNQKVTREYVMVTTAGNLFREYKDRMAAEDVVSALSSAAEWKDIFSGAKADSGLGKLESKLQSSTEFILPLVARKKLEQIEEAAGRKALALIWAYLTRADLDDSSLEADKYEVIPVVMQVLNAFTSICLSYGFTSPLLACYRLRQCLTQAISPAPTCLPLLQLPHFTPKVIHEIEKKATSKKEHMTTDSFMALPAEQRVTLAQAAGLSKDHLHAAESVARQLPHLRIEKAFFKVQGEKYIIPSSLVQFVIKARFIPPGTTDIPPVNEKDLLDIDPAEGDLAAQRIEPERHPLPLTHAPYLPSDKAPSWHVFLADYRQGKVAVPPFSFTAFDKKPFDDEGKPTFEVVTIKMQFQAPPQPGEYKFQMHMICDSYLGFDHSREVLMQIDDASKALEVDEDDDISEPEEDSLSGQMAMLKGQPVADPNKPKRTRKPPVKTADEESDYESGTDEDEDSESETDTDTDTDGE